MILEYIYISIYLYIYIYYGRNKRTKYKPKRKTAIFLPMRMDGGIGDLAISLWFHYSTITEKIFLVQGVDL